MIHHKTITSKEVHLQDLYTRFPSSVHRDGAVLHHHPIMTKVRSRRAVKRGAQRGNLDWDTMLEIERERERERERAREIDR